jgi:Glycosyltransferase family 87
MSADEVLAIAGRVAKIRAARAEHRGSFGGAYLRIPFRWQVSYFSRNGKEEIGQVIIDDFSGRVVEAWTGFQVAWTMARGYAGAFGKHVNSLYVWLPMCALFFFAFFDYRRPFSLLHLDLLVLLSFSVSLAFFNHAHIYASVPLAYPPLAYLLARMLALARGSARARARPLRLLVPAPWLGLAVVFLIAFRIALNVTDSNVIDVGYAGVIGAKRIVDGRPLYGGYPRDNEHGDTYGPVNYEAYVPFVATLGFSGKWDDLPAAHGAAIAFDLLAAALLFLLGRRVRGPSHGIALAYAWVSFPFTLYALESNSNDSLVAVFVLAALLAACSRRNGRAGTRGALSALAGLTKFAPLALAPLLALHRQPGAARSGAAARALTRSRLVFVLAFAVATALALVPAFTHDSLHTIFTRTITNQAQRESPFSLWGLYSGLGTVQHLVQAAAVLLAIALALRRRGRDVGGLAAACAAVILAVQLGVTHWFYLYIPWFFGLVVLALLASFSSPQSSAMAGASGSARSTRRAAVLSSG